MAVPPEDIIYELQQKIRKGSTHLDRVVAGTPRNAQGASPAVAPPPARKFKWSTTADDVYKFNPATATALENIDAPIDWTALKGVDKSDDGAEGVFFAELVAGVVVLKASRSVGSELFCSLLKAYVDVYAPPVRVIRTESEEGHALLNAVKKADRTGRAMMTLFDMAYIVVMGYVAHAQTFAQLRSVNTDLYLTPKSFRQLGALLAVDILVNNGDRLPCALWDNPGNAGNVLLCDDQVVAIDSQISAINTMAHPERFEAYKEGVRKMLVQVLDAKSTDPFSGIRGLVVTNAQVDIGDAGLSSVRDGFVETIKLCAQKQDELVGTIMSWRDTLLQFQPPLVQIGNVNVDFVSGILSLYAAHFSS